MDKNRKRKRDKMGRFIKGDGGGPGSPKKVRVSKEELDVCETVTDKAYKILETGLYSTDKKEQLECAKLLAKLNPQKKPKEVLSPRAREIIEFWVKHHIVSEQAEEGSPSS